MEHRLFRRFASDHPVEIHQGHRCIVQARARNVSREGALLEADELGQGHCELELKAQAYEVTPHRMRGVVIDRDDYKLGVMLLDTWSDSDWKRLTASGGAVTGPAAAGRAA